MSRPQDRNSLVGMLGTLGWPMFVGLAASSVFYGLVLRGPLQSPLIHRYFAAHPVSYAATVMFFIGMAALIMKLANVLGQFGSLTKVDTVLDGWDDQADEPLQVDRCGEVLDAIDSLPPIIGQTYLAKRLRDALEHVERKGSADDLDDELKYLADLDAVRQQDGYALVRIISWATPMLGFLGTVIGITQALGDLNPSEMAASIETAMDGLLSGLYVAFDTTTLALTLSIILMFCQFLVERLETQLLSRVDERIGETLVGRFEQIGAGTDPHLASIQRMGQEVIRSSEQLVKRQAELWQTSMVAADERWSRLVEQSQQQLHTALAAALSESLRAHAEVLGEMERETSERATERFASWQKSVGDSAQQLHQHQQEMVRQSEMLARVVEATGDVVKLEEALNDNLSQLAGTRNFEDTVMSLSAAIHLLNARLGSPSGDSQRVSLTPPERAA